jgi:hypothetical protein
MSVEIGRHDAALDRDGELVNEIAPAMKTSLEQQCVRDARGVGLVVFLAVSYLVVCELSGFQVD